METQISDAELFETAVAQEAPPEPVTEAAPEQPASPDAQPPPERERNEKGQFVKKDKAEEAPVPIPEVTPQMASPEANVPSWRLREEREARERAESQFANLQAQLQQMQWQLQRERQPEKP